MNLTEIHIFINFGADSVIMSDLSKAVVLYRAPEFPLLSSSDQETSSARPSTSSPTPSATSTLTCSERQSLRRRRRQRRAAPPSYPNQGGISVVYSCVTTQPFSIGIFSSNSTVMNNYGQQGQSQNPQGGYQPMGYGQQPNLTPMGQGPQNQQQGSAYGQQGQPGNPNQFGIAPQQGQGYQAAQANYYHGPAYNFFFANSGGYDVNLRNFNGNDMAAMGYQHQQPGPQYQHQQQQQQPNNQQFQQQTPPPPYQAPMYANAIMAPPTYHHNQNQNHYGTSAMQPQPTQAQPQHVFGQSTSGAFAPSFQNLNPAPLQNGVHHGNCPAGGQHHLVRAPLVDARPRFGFPRSVSAYSLSSTVSDYPSTECSCGQCHAAFDCDSDSIFLSQSK